MLKKKKKKIKKKKNRTMAIQVSLIETMTFLNLIKFIH